MLPDFRRFAATTQAVDQAWSTSFSSNESWTSTGRTWGTENGPVEVTNASGLVGVQKPGRDGVGNPNTAATEKIVADLAYQLGLPVPPVTLWDRGTGCTGPRFVAVSGWAYVGALTWGQAEAGLTADQKIALQPWASAMLPFESWIGAQDRHNAGNMLVADDPVGGVLAAWIDYAFSLDHTWRGNQMPHCQLGQIYPPAAGAAATDVMIEVADKIAAVDNVIIEGIVNRIPSTYLPRAAADNIIHNLQHRRANVRAIL